MLKQPFNYLFFLIYIQIFTSTRSHLQLPCISEHQLNEVFSLCANKKCENTCENPSASLECRGLCKPDCVCAPGFVRNSFDNCVTIAECERKPKCTGVNEVYSSCGNDGCQPTCSRLVVSGCISTCSTQKCICLPGYVRNAFNICVSPGECPTPSCTKPNEVYSACGDDGCQRRCNRMDVTTCVSVCSVPACICIPGYVRNANDDCVLPSTCPMTVQCTRNNEVFSICGNDGCQRTCSRLNVDMCVPLCSTPGCICDVPYVRNGAGDCVLRQTCPNFCTGQNEIYSQYADDGCQRTCSRPDISGCTGNCGSPGCICRSGFIRNNTGSCVVPTQCSMECPGPNQIFSFCGNDGCQRTCTNIDTTNCMPRCTNPGCICRPGYVLNDRQQCILPQDCVPTCPGPNQIFSSCGNDGCRPTCNNLQVTCMPMCSAPECICAPGFVENDLRQCILLQTCPQHQCPNNLIFSNCGCLDTCLQNVMFLFDCLRNCPPPACVCPLGTRFNENTRMCVPIDPMTRVCL